MVDYCTLEDVKAYLTTSQSTDDLLLADLITDCSRAIDTLTKRHFYGNLETRTFDAVKNVYRNTLMLDEDLSTVVSITNGDGNTISASDYVLEPRNWTPRYGITLKVGSGKVWTYQTDPENAIAVNGSWGYVNGTTPPEVIKRACIRLVRYQYLEKSKKTENIQVPDAIQKMLDPYVKNLMTGIG